MKRTLSTRSSAVLEVMNKPKTFTELRNHIGYNKGGNISSMLKELQDLNLIFCMTPKSKNGRLYGLTDKGIRFRRELLRDQKHPAKYTFPANVNWKLYGWIICGRQRLAILKGLFAEMSLKYIKERAQEYNPRISRMNCHDILELFSKKIF